MNANEKAQIQHHKENSKEVLRERKKSKIISMADKIIYEITQEMYLSDQGNSPV